MDDVCLQQYLSCLALGIPGIVVASYLGNLCLDMRTAYHTGELDKARELQVDWDEFFNYMCARVCLKAATVLSFVRQNNVKYDQCLKSVSEKYLSYNNYKRDIFTNWL